MSDLAGALRASVDAAIQARQARLSERQQECKATGHEPVVRSAALGEALGTWLCACGKVRWVVEGRT